MIFTEIRFVVLFLGCALCFFLVPSRLRTAVLAFWGAVFYAVYAGWFLLIALGLALVTLFSGRRAVALAGGAATIFLLVFFKIPGGGRTAPLLVPLGFSYLAFELLHVMIERRRGRITELAPADLLAFVFFMPARVAGPIKRYPEFVSAVQDAELSIANVYEGIRRILIGLFKKLVLADLLALTVGESAYVYSGRQAWTIVLAYSLQIYFDFSAYSDIAIGLARILGITLPENFRRPYFSANIREFWDRWHITLSHWVRDYVFVPFGRKLFQTKLRRQPPVMATLSYLVTFLIVGAWHGLTAAFLLWGLYHGVLLSCYHITRLKMPLRVASHPWYHSRMAQAAGVVITFGCVTVGWVPFMMPLKQAEHMLALMFGIGK